MNRVTRLLALAGVGIGVAAGVAVGAAPAQAAGQSGTQSTTVQAKANWGRNDFRLEDTFRSYERCVVRGWIGERRGEWEDSACLEIRYGFGGDDWALVVSDDDDCDWGRYNDRRFYGGRNYGEDRGVRYLRNGGGFNGFNGSNGSNGFNGFNRF